MKRIDPRIYSGENASRGDAEPQRGRDHFPASPRLRVSELWVIVVSIAMAGLLAIPACHSCECHDIPKGAVPPPCGTYICQWNDAETTRAAADKFVVYQYEWIDDKLSPFGERHMPQIAHQLPLVPWPVVVEPSGDAKLDQRRRQAVFEALSQCGNISEDRIIFGHSEALGLPGYEALRDGLQLMSGKETTNAGMNQGVNANPAQGNAYQGTTMSGGYAGGSTSGVDLSVGTGAY
jgi:hypothetical protein